MESLPNFFVYGNGGYSLSIDTFSKGLYAEAGIAYYLLPITKSKKSGFKFRLGYNHKEMKTPFKIYNDGNFVDGGTTQLSYNFLIMGVAYCF